jgi:hypothetical protein
VEIQDSTKVVQDTVYFGEKGDIETAVVYSARDSIRFDIIKRLMYLYGEATITYGDVKLTAGYVELDWLHNTIRANALSDSTGKGEGIPVFTDKDTDYNADSIYYNFKTQKGVVKGIITQQGEGFLRADKAKRLADGTLYNATSIYTTCDLEHPHYAIRARKLKLNNDKNIVAGPFNLVINDIPTPLGFGFGLFPFPNKKSSGLIVPTYGEAQDRGFFLRDGGFYWAVNDYLSARFLGQIYSLGGWGSTLDMDYKKRYNYSGRLNFSYNKVVRTGNDDEKDINKDFWVRWNHSPIPRGSSRFSASVNFGTATYNQNNSFNVTNYLSSSFNSNISYSKTFTGTPFSFSANLRHNQNIQTEIATVTPEANLSMNRVFPFKKIVKNSKSPLAQLNVGYTGNTKLDISNNLSRRSYGFSTIQPEFDEIGDDTLQFNGENISTLFERSKYGAIHKIPISTGITVAKYFQVTPSLNYTEYWYPRKLNYKWSDAEQAVVVTEEQGFNRAYEYSTALGASTTFYLFYNFKENVPVRAIRQLITPSASLGYRPDFEDEKYGFFQNVQVDSIGTMQNVSRFQSFLFGSPAGGRSESLNVNLETQFEAKVKSKKDTVNGGMKKINLLRASTSYNVLADSFNLANISFVTNAKVWGERVSLTFNGSIDPYGYIPIYDEEGNFSSQRRSKTFAWNSGQGIGSLSRMTISANTQLTPEGLKGGDDPMKKSTSDGQDPNQALLDDIAANPDQYIDFNIPWTLNLRYNLNYSKTGFADPNITQSLTFSGDVSLTEKWKIDFTSGYDFTNKKFSFTSIGINRDLHCWQMAVSWVPFGERQSYTLDIRVKSSILQDLKVSKRNVWFDR